MMWKKGLNASREKSTLTSMGHQTRELECWRGPSLAEKRKSSSKLSDGAVGEEKRKVNEMMKERRKVCRTLRSGMQGCSSHIVSVGRCKAG